MQKDFPISSKEDEITIAGRKDLIEYYQSLQEGEPYSLEDLHDERIWSRFAEEYGRAAKAIS
ncbi:MAG: hypothetical protein ABEJ72_10730, partial [Candidatus Aenigmatarchaeota archaeon]